MGAERAERLHACRWWQAMRLHLAPEPAAIAISAAQLQHACSTRRHGSTHLDFWAGVQQLAHANGAAQAPALDNEWHVGAFARPRGSIQPNHLTRAHQALQAGERSGRAGWVGDAAVGSKVPAVVALPALSPNSLSPQSASQQQPQPSNQRTSLYFSSILFQLDSKMTWPFKLSRSLLTASGRSAPGGTTGAKAAACCASTAASVCAAAVAVCRAPELQLV